ncbi:MAG: glutathione S-transferase family protein [Rhodospirillales bacterium]|nr:glutathione S-transferase family protein [Rhodospirillales bacterium]
MKLYDWHLAPNPRRVRMYLAEKGIDIPIEEVGAGPNLTLDPAYLKKHPHGLVPCLELDDGTMIGEAMAICRYFETEHPDPPLMGTDAKDRALVEMWERKADMEGLHAASEAFRNLAPDFKGRGLPGQRGDTIPQLPVLVQRGTARVARFYQKIDEQLGKNPYLAGERFSVADITAFCSIDFAKWIELDIPAECKNVQRWYDEVSKRESVAA